MLMTGSDTARDQLLIALEIDQTDVGTIANQNIAVAALQSGACDDAVCARTTAVVDRSGEDGENRAISPGQLSFLRQTQRHTSLHNRSL